MMFDCTVASLCKSLGVSVPECLEDKKNEQLSFLTCNVKHVKSGGGFYVRGFYKDGSSVPFRAKQQSARSAIKAGAVCVFSEEQFTDEQGQDLPCVIINNVEDSFIEYFAEKRKLINARVVAVSGSVGKTTTKEMMALVAKEAGPVLYSKENANGFSHVVAHMQKIEPEMETYIQEAGAFYPGLVEKLSRMLRPDACVITNVGEPHIDLYGTVDNIAFDKLSLARNLSDGGVAFLNLDDPRLKVADIPSKVVWYSRENPAADFYAKNVVLTENSTDFDVAGSCETTHVSLSTYGIHNVINAVAAFAFGKWLGVEEEVIARALAKYKSAGIRQNLCDIGGYKLYVDCFNSAPNSLLGCLETVERISLPEKSKRIAVLGDIPRLGESSKRTHIECAKDVAKYNIDEFLCYGEDMEFMSAELVKMGVKSRFTADRNQLNDWLRNSAKVGDLVLFKAGHPMHLSKTIDQVFGTSFYFTDAEVRIYDSKEFECGSWKGRLFDEMAEVSSGPVADELTVPGLIEDCPVTRIAKDAFSGQPIKHVVLPDGLSNIGARSFHKCDLLEAVAFPPSLKVIERSAFNRCKSLKEVRLPDGLISIGARAFLRCSSLRKVVIGSNVGSIDMQAFMGCSRDLTIYGDKGSYAEAYAKAEGIPFKERRKEKEFVGIRRFFAWLKG